MGERTGKRWWVAVLLGLLAPFVVPEVAGPASAKATLCGARDLPETGLQGDVPLADQLSGRADQGYNCGLALLGYSSLGGRGSNANMAWSGDCAYIAGPGVAVVDVRDPQHPKHVRTLHTGGSESTVETLSAVDAPDRHILVTGRYGIGGLDGDGPGVAPVDVWDVSDCANPKQLSTIAFPGNVHNVTLTADGKRVWATLPLRAADISDPRHPKVLPRIEPQLTAAGSQAMVKAHEAWPSPDGTRLFVANQGFPNDTEQMLVVDIAGWPRRPARILGSASVPGHSIRPMQIDGRPYLLMSDESVVNATAKGCLPDKLTPLGGIARPKLVDISHEELPRVRSQLHLEINEPKHCAEQLLSGVNGSGHYHDVDDARDTTFAMVSMWNSGLRLFDVRDPTRPREVAYFNPGRFRPPENPLAGGVPTVGGLSYALSPYGLDQAWAHVRYRPDTGQIWLTTSSGGFWVLELEPQVRKALDLPARPTVHPRGAVPRPPMTQGVVRSTSAASLYCALTTARVL